MSKPEANNSHLKAVEGAGDVKSAPAKESHATPKPQAQISGRGNVLALPGMCMAEQCKQKSVKANFCQEHFDWFKEGLITKEGRRPTDFEKKHFDYTRRKKPAA